MNMPVMNKSEQKALSVVTILVLAFSAYFLRGYFSLIVLAGVLAYLFTPLYNRFNKRLGSGFSATITLLCSFLLVILPLILVVYFATSQLRGVIDGISERASTLDLGTLGSQTVDGVNNILKKIPVGSYSVSEQSLIDSGKNFVSKFGSTALDYLTGIAGSVFGLLSALIVYVYLFTALLTKGPKLVQIFREINPLGKDISDLYLDRSGAMVRGTVKGQFAIAVAQGLIGATTIALAGLSNVFFVLFIVLSLLSVIPLGGGILAIPIGIVMMLFGNVSGGLLVVLGHLLVTSNIDSVLRPRLIPKQARIDSALMLIAVFSGIAMFGFLGIIIGPTIIILALTTVQVYLMVHKDYAPEAEPTKKRRVITKLFRRNKI